MKETAYQNKIKKAIIAIGGHAFTGTFPTGEADLVCGYPIEQTVIVEQQDSHGVNYHQVEKKLMLFLQVEVKTEHDYHRVMKAIDKDYNVINKTPLKPHEVLQLAKIQNIRKRGGLALVAFEFKQVEEYVNANR